jgi:hypothetical protein
MIVLPQPGDRWERYRGSEYEVVSVRGVVEEVNGEWIANGVVALRNLTKRRRQTVQLSTFLRAYHPIYEPGDFEDLPPTRPEIIAQRIDA